LPAASTVVIVERRELGAKRRSHCSSGALIGSGGVVLDLLVGRAGGLRAQFMSVIRRCIQILYR
jgi:hypothetical protein